MRCSCRLEPKPLEEPKPLDEPKPPPVIEETISPAWQLLRSSPGVSRSCRAPLMLVCALLRPSPPRRPSPSPYSLALAAVVLTDAPAASAQCFMTVLTALPTAALAL